MSDPEITLSMSREAAEILLGVLSAERHNPDAETVCASLRQQLDEELAGSS